MASKYTYRMEFKMMDGHWDASTFWLACCPVVYLRGYLDCYRYMTPRLAARIVRSDGKIIEELEAREDVGIGMIAGRPSPEQYEAAAARALKTAAALRAARAKPSEETVERKAAEVDHTARRLAALRAEKKARLRREYGIELCEACGAILREDTPRVACEDCSLCLACGDSMGGA